MIHFSQRHKTNSWQAWKPAPLVVSPGELPQLAQQIRRNVASQGTSVCYVLPGPVVVSELQIGGSASDPGGGELRIDFDRRSEISGGFCRMSPLSPRLAAMAAEVGTSRFQS